MRTLHVALPVLLLAGLLTSCSQTAKRGAVGTLQPSPGPEQDDDRLSELLALGAQEPRCPEGAELQRARASHVEDERSRDAREAGRRAQAGEWFLSSEGLSDGQVVLVAGKPIPDELLVYQGRELLAQWRQQWEALAENGLDDTEPMAAGLVDQLGFRILELERVDARIRLTEKDNVFGFYAGPSLRTRQGTGLGSTLPELEAAHGPSFLGRVPEPYHCSVSFASLSRVNFFFRDCDRACLGDAVLQVYVGGYEGPEDELPWGQLP